MESKVEIFGISCPMIIEDWRDKFELSTESPLGKIFISKEEFTFKTDGDIPPFRYRYLIDCCTYGINRCWNIVLYMVICPQDTTKAYKKDLLDMCGFDSSEKVTYIDMAESGGCVPFGYTELGTTIFDNAIITAIANAMETMNNNINEYLCKPINASGTDGWKVIRHCLLDESLF